MSTDTTPIDRTRFFFFGLVHDSILSWTLSRAELYLFRDRLGAEYLKQADETHFMQELTGRGY